MEIISLAIVLNLLVLLFLFSFVEIATAVPPLALPGCDSKCGDVDIPYPFGLREGCFSDPNYKITCDARSGTLKPYYANLTEVLEISLLEAHFILGDLYASTECFDNTGRQTQGSYFGYSVADLPFRFSTTRNKLIGIGCNTVAFLDSNFGGDNANFTSGCISLCDKLDSVINGSCSGIGCCQTSVPLGLKNFVVTLGSQVSNSLNWKFNPCSFAFIGDYESFTFKSSHLSRKKFDRSQIPLVLDWAIGNDTCGPNSYPSKSTNAPGYNCTCKDGFEGNPYLPDQGCQDKNECEDWNNNYCAPNAICINTYGNYTCQCREGYRGDGMLYVDGNSAIHGSGCTKDMKRMLVIKIVAGTGAGFVGLSALVLFLYWAIQRKRREREKFFNQNGGLLLQQQIASKEGAKDVAKIFSSKALKKATGNFHESQIIGEGGFGRVYKGILSSGKVVAIKKSKIVDKGQIIQFINEVDILSQINHRHVVKLLGCCLEIEVPLLVYEFISNGTLSEHIHRKNQTPSLSWGNRLRIAAETADALAYLHSSHAIPIFHRDVKSSNILLDDKYRAKVSDFGASRLVPLDETQKMTQIQGTHGYLDPECLPTGQLTDKSDVYSFGVVLLELLTGKKPLLYEESGNCTTLVSYFLSSMTDGNLFHIIDDKILIDGKREQLLAVAELARDCLKDKREDRPTMKEVAKELDSLKMFYEQSSTHHNQETEPFLGEPWTSSTDATFEMEMSSSVTDDDLSLVTR